MRLCREPMAGYKSMEGRHMRWSQKWWITVLSNSNTKHSSHQYLCPKVDSPYTCLPCISNWIGSPQNPCWVSGFLNLTEFKGGPWIEENNLTLFYHSLYIIPHGMLHTISYEIYGIHPFYTDVEVHREPLTTPSLFSFWTFCFYCYVLFFSFDPSLLLKSQECLRGFSFINRAFASRTLVAVQT